LIVPEAWVLFVTVRVSVPAAAVIVTEVAFESFQVSVTLWPDVIEAALADNTTLGLTGGGGGLFGVLMEQPARPPTASSNIPLVIRRKPVWFIRCPGRTIDKCEIQMPCQWQQLPR